ncbi:hypothetical protein F3Y22_tig00110809pilonHSYRG00089 [Hibiscus syriacus]|uniref:Uncharacterized protein n=1 Tax=Hibiscus syriacus TaxID=106335 RepID=A0A6A2ZQX2_HIBSY|nr:hypothetical protein F3Y22_tig00110809pilonHSYRG00089 [Hibiscus syriacus]
MENQLPCYLLQSTSLIFIFMALRTWLNSKSNQFASKLPQVLQNCHSSGTYTSSLAFRLIAAPPVWLTTERIAYNFQDMVFSRCDYSRQILKICVLELLIQKRVQSFRTIREEEVYHLAETIKSNAGMAINLKNLLHSLSLTIFSRTAFGGRFKQQGAGKRMCPGMSYGIANVELILANPLYHIDWKVPNGMEPRDLDMAEIFRASLRRKHYMCLVPLPC